MIGVALKGLAARKLRAVLTAFAVVIGVAMVAGTFMLTDTLQKSFSGLFTESTSNTDAVVRGKEVVKNSTSGSGVTIPASLLTKVRALPEVGSAAGEVNPAEANVADIYGRDGKKAARESVGASIDPANAKFSPLRLKTGAWPTRARRGRHRRRHRRPRSTTRSATRSSSGRSARSTPTRSPARCRSAPSTRSASRASRPGTSRRPRRCCTARAATTPCRIAAKKGSSPAAVVRAVKPLLGSNLEVKDAKAQAKDDADNLNEGLRIIKLFLLGFGFIALLVGAFVIFNTMSITVAQRTREYATLRTLGASRKQVLRSVKIEGARDRLRRLGDRARARHRDREGPHRAVRRHGRRAAEGIHGDRDAHDRLLAAARHRHHAARQHHPGAPGHARAADRGRPRGRRPCRSRGSPATPRRPASASRSPHSPRSRSGIFASGVSGAAVALLLGGGVLGLFAGIALLAPRLVKPLARVVGLPARRAGGVAGEIASANSVRNPGRTASTAAALMIGLTLVTVVAVLGSGLRVVDAEGGQATRSPPTTSSTASRSCRSGPPRATSSRHRRREGRHARPLRPRARAGQGEPGQRDRSRHDRALLPLRLVEGLLRSHARAARNERRARDEGLRRERAPEGRRSPRRSRRPRAPRARW